MSKKEEAEYEEYENLKNSKFKQQKLPGWRPVPSMARTVTIFICFGIVFVCLGVLILLFSNNIVEFSERYDNNPNCNSTIDGTCEIVINITKKMNKNILVYYQLDGFYQNHRRYVQSRSEAQLRGENISLEKMRESQDCDPVVTNEEMNVIDTNPLHNNKLKPNETAIPCGLMAKSFFNDTFQFKLLSEGNKTIKVNDTNIARKSDIDKFKNIDLSLQWMDMTNEHFIVWMRPAPLPNFRKLYGRILEDIDADSQIVVEISNNYNVSSFNGAKHIILTTVNNFGGKNYFLSIGYMILGGICLILSIIFIIGFKIHAKKEK